MRNIQTLTLLLMCLSLNTFAYTGEVTRSFPAPAEMPTGMTFDGTHLWLADRGTDLIYRIDPETGNVLSTLETPGYWPSGLAWDGQNLWCSDTRGGKDEAEAYQGMIYRIDPRDGTVLSTVAAPGNHPSGLAWDGTYLWCVDDHSGEIIQFSPYDGTTIRSFPSPHRSPLGLAFDGTWLWVADKNLDELHMVDPVTGTVVLITSSPGPYPWGLCFDGTHLWNADYENDRIYRLTVGDDEKFRMYNERKMKVTYTHRIRNFGPGLVKTTDIYLAVPGNRNNQTIDEIDFPGLPEDAFVTDKWGQKTAHYQFRNIPSGEVREGKMTATVSTAEVRYFIFPDKVGGLDEIPAELTGQYLENNEKFQYDHEVIRDAVRKVVGDEKNPYWIARRIFNHLIDNMYYEMTGGWNTAPTVLERGNGSCSEYTFVFIAMCRASGIPARYVGSVVERGDVAGMDNVFHRWAEIYLPNYGWVPVDGSRGDREHPRDQTHAFGYVAGNLLITTQSGGGSETMEWTYNSNAFWTTEPKTYVNSDHYGDWEPLKED